MDVSLTITRPAASISVVRYPKGRTVSVSITRPPAQASALVVHP